jgi:hypothetical protein
VSLDWQKQHCSGFLANPSQFDRYLIGAEGCAGGNRVDIGLINAGKLGKMGILWQQHWRASALVKRQGWQVATDSKIQ